MPYCTKCGFENDYDNLFCINCGEKIESNKQFSNKQKSGNKKVIKYAIIMLLICSFVVYIFSNNTIIIEFKFDLLSYLRDIIKSSELEDSKLQGKQPIFNSNLYEIEPSDKYSYQYKNCNQLITDVFKGVCYSIQNEIVEVTKISENEENLLGEKLAKIVKGQYKGIIDQDKKLSQYIQSLGQELIKHVDRKKIAYHFHVINNNNINAFAIPGGGIYIFKGLMKTIKNEAQLAMVIAHEVKHVDLRHCIALYQVVKNFSKELQDPMHSFLNEIVIHPYNSQIEADADKKGLELIYSFGYSPFQTVKYWEDFERENRENQDENVVFEGIFGKIAEEVENVLYTHPKYPKRICLLKNHIIRLKKAYPAKYFYIGKWNLDNQESMFITKR